MFSPGLLTAYQASLLNQIYEMVQQFRGMTGISPINVNWVAGCSPVLNYTNDGSIPVLISGYVSGGRLASGQLSYCFQEQEFTQSGLRVIKQAGTVGSGFVNPLFELNGYNLASQFVSGSYSVQAYAKRRGLAGTMGQAYEFSAGADSAGVYAQAYELPALPGQGPRRTIDLKNPIPASEAVGSANLEIELAGLASDSRHIFTIDNLGQFTRIKSEEGYTTTTTYPDGSTITVTTNSDGSTTTTVTYPDGTSTTTTENSDGTITPDEEAPPAGTVGPRRRINFIRKTFSVFGGSSNLDYVLSDSDENDEAVLTVDNLGIFARVNEGSPQGPRRAIDQTIPEFDPPTTGEDGEVTGGANGLAGGNIAISLEDSEANDEHLYTIDNLGEFGSVNADDDGSLNSLTNYETDTPAQLTSGMSNLNSGASQISNLSTGNVSTVNRLTAGAASLEEVLNRVVAGVAPAGEVPDANAGANWAWAVPQLNNLVNQSNAIVGALGTDPTGQLSNMEDLIEGMGRLQSNLEESENGRLGPRRQFNFQDYKTGSGSQELSIIEWEVQDRGPTLDRLDFKAKLNLPNLEATGLVGTKDWHYYREVGTVLSQAEDVNGFPVDTLRAVRHFNPFPVEFAATGSSEYNPMGVNGAIGITCVPYLETRGGTLNKIGVYCTSAFGANWYVRLGIYQSASPVEIYPQNLILDAGLVDATSVGLREIEINLPLTPGLYFLAVQCSANFNSEPLLTGYIQARNFGTDALWAPWGVAVDGLINPGSDADWFRGINMAWDPSQVAPADPAWYGNKVLPDPFTAYMNTRYVVYRPITKAVTTPIIYVGYSS